MDYLEYPSVIDIDETEMAGNFGPNAEGIIEINNWISIQLIVLNVWISDLCLKIWLKTSEIITSNYRQI